MGAFNLTTKPETIYFELDLSPLGKFTSEVDFYADNEGTYRRPIIDNVEIMTITVNGKDIYEIVASSWPDQFSKLEDYIYCGTWAIDDDY